MQAISEQIYKNVGANADGAPNPEDFARASGGPSTDRPRKPSGDDVVDAEFEVVDEEKK
jgi:hypothetical protein